MSDVHQVLLSIEHLAEELLKRNRHLEEQTRELKMTLLKLEREVQLKNEQIERQQKEMKEMHTARGLLSKDEDAQMAKAKINSLVREIDRCIALLNE